MKGKIRDWDNFLFLTLHADNVVHCLLAGARKREKAKEGVAMFKPVDRTVMGLLICVLIACQPGPAISQSAPEAEDTPGQTRFIPHKSFSGNVSAKSSELYNKGTMKLHAGRYEEALVLLLAAVEESRENVDAWDHLGICYRRTGRYREAVEAYETSIGINPSNPVPYGNLGLIYAEHLNDLDKAQGYYQKSIELDSEWPEGYYGLAKVCEKRKDSDAAIANYLKAMERYKRLKSPVIVDAYMGLGWNYAFKQPPDYRKAAQYFLEAKKAGHPLNPEIEEFIRRALGDEK